MEIDVSQQLKEFFKKFKHLRYTKGETIIRGDDEPTGIFYIVKGFVKYYSITTDGKELTLNIFKPGSYFPIHLVLADIPNYYYYETMTPVEVYKAPIKDVKELLDTNNEILNELTKRLSVGLNGLLVRMQYLLLNDARHKIVSTFVFLGRRFGVKGTNGSMLIDIPLTHFEISNLACLTRETASVEIKKLEKEGYVHRKKSNYVINDFDKLFEESLVYVDDRPIPTY